MRIVVTGADGFIGHHFLEHILINKPDWKIDAVCSLHNGGVGLRLIVSKRISKGIQNGSIRVLSTDLTRPMPMAIANSVAGADVMVCFASRSHVDASLVEPASFFKDNVDIALNELELAREAKPRVLIFISTDEVYGPAHVGTSHKEWAVIAPSNPYSASKAAQEAAGFAWWRAYNVPLVFINSMNIIGERQHPEKFIPMVMQKIAAGEEVLIHAIKLGEDWLVGSRHFLHARNLSDAVLFLVNKYLAEPVPKYRYSEVERPPRFHVSGEEATNLELAQMLAKEMGIPLKYRLYDAHSARPGHDLRYALDSSLIHSLGWKQPINLQESIKRVVKWTMENKEWLSPETFDSAKT